MYEIGPNKNQRCLSVRWIRYVKATKNGLQLQDNLKNSLGKSEKEKSPTWYISCSIISSHTR